MKNFKSEVKQQSYVEVKNFKSEVKQQSYVDVKNFKSEVKQQSYVEVKREGEEEDCADAEEREEKTKKRRVLGM